MNSRGYSVIELLSLLVMTAIVGSFLYQAFTGGKQNNDLVVAASRVNMLYQRQILQFSRATTFSYSLAKAEKQTSFLKVIPPAGSKSKLIGYPGYIQKEGSKQERLAGYRPWSEVGFPLKKTSYFIYRVEPEPAVFKLAKISESDSQFYTVRVAAIADIHGTGRYTVLSRYAYFRPDEVMKTSPKLFLFRGDL